jgi:hypothetical protein
VQVRIAVLADFASIAVGQKLNILGIFTAIYASAEPIHLPQLQVVISMEFDPTEAGPKDAKIVLVDEDGKELMVIGGRLDVTRSPNPAPIIVNQVLAFGNVVFPKFGSYEFKFLVGGELKATIPLTVTQLSQARLPGV